MYRRPRFLEVLLEIRAEMAREADYDTDLFAEIVRHGGHSSRTERHSLNESQNEKSGDARQKRPAA